MSDDMDGVDMAIMSKFGKRASATLEGRRERETRPIARSDRVAISHVETKSRQLNLKITPSLYEQISAFARNERVSMPVMLEKMAAMWSIHRG